ncbi:hypothetical protein Z043_110424, partial [Scleropages formosus]
RKATREQADVVTRHCGLTQAAENRQQKAEETWLPTADNTAGEHTHEPQTPSGFNMQQSMASGMDPATAKANQCSDQGKPCNSCLDAAKACNLNDTCKKQRSHYISTCNKDTAVQTGQRSEPCNRKRCHKALRLFFDRVQTEYTYRMLFCPCRDTACAERRRQTIVPSCAFEEKVKPNCLELRKTCRSDPLCRSRLADFHMNCQTTPHSITNCPNENYQACLTSYVGLIGSDMTLNYVDASYTNITISPWCTCRSSGNQEEECEKFLSDFRENTCLRNAIYAFGYGPDSGPFAKPVAVTPSLRPDVEPVSLSEPSVNQNDIKDDACVFSTCANLKPWFTQHAH